MRFRSWWFLLGWGAVFLSGGVAIGLYALAETATVPQNVAYVSNEEGGVTVLDLHDFKVIREIPVDGVGPRGIVVTPDGRYVLTANKRTKDVSVIDTVRMEVVRRIPIGTNPEFLRLHPNGYWIFTSHEPGARGGPPGKEREEEEEAALQAGTFPPSRIVIIDTRAWTVVRSFQGGLETEGIAFTPDGKRLVVTNEADDTVSVFDIATGERVHHIDLSEQGYRPRGIKVSPDGRYWVVTLEASSNLALLDAEFRILRFVPTGRGPYGVAFDRSGTRLFVAAARAQQLQVFSFPDLRLQHEIPVGRRCWHFTFTPDDRYILIACGRSHDVHVIDARTYEKVRVITGFKLPWGIVTYPHAYGSLDMP